MFIYDLISRKLVTSKFTHICLPKSCKSLPSIDSDTISLNDQSWYELINSIKADKMKTPTKTPNTTPPLRSIHARKKKDNSLSKKFANNTKTNTIKTTISIKAINFFIDSFSMKVRFADRFM